MIVPLDSTAECSVADVVWVSLWSLSLKFIVPDSSVQRASNRWCWRIR